MWRIYGSPHFAIPHIDDIYERWTIDQVADAHLFLDIQEDLEVLKLPRKTNR